jgi:ABC-type Na+ efflux pump permease subunit
MLQSYGQWVLTAVTREKASRVVEVLLAVITPRQLLVGKIAGIGVVALVHAAVLIVVAYAATQIVGVDLAAGIGLGDFALAAVWFLLGYALYCGAFAAAGSLVSRVEDAQGVAFPIMLPLLFGYIASFTAAGGASTLLWVLAFCPPTAVVAMPTSEDLGPSEYVVMVLPAPRTRIGRSGLTSPTGPARDHPRQRRPPAERGSGPTRCRVWAAPRPAGRGARARAGCRLHRAAT